MTDWNTHTLLFLLTRNTVNLRMQLRIWNSASSSLHSVSTSSNPKMILWIFGIRNQDSQRLCIHRQSYPEKVMPCWAWVAAPPHPLLAVVVCKLMKFQGCWNWFIWGWFFAKSFVCHFCITILIVSFSSDVGIDVGIDVQDARSFVCHFYMAILIVSSSNDVEIDVRIGLYGVLCKKFCMSLLHDHFDCIVV